MTQPIIILHVITDLNAGGAELMMKRLIESHLADPRYEHRVISLRGLGPVAAPLRAQGISVKALGLTSALRLPAAVLRLVSLIRSERPDVVQTWMYHADLFGGLAARGAGVRNVLWGVRVADISPEMGVAPQTFRIRRACAYLSRHIPKKIIYVCHSARPPHEALGYDPSKGLVIPNGYVLRPNRTRQERLELRRRIGLPEQALLIGSAGRWSAQKDFPTFVEAASLLAATWPEAQFVLMGREVDWNNPQLARMVRESGVAGHFHLLGERRDIGDCLAALDVFSLQSIQEGFPNVVAEAMAEGTPCVVTDVGDAALLVGETAAVIDPRQPAQLAAALGRLLAASPLERQALGRQARSRIEEHFSISAVAAQYASLYRDMIHS